MVTMLRPGASNLEITQAHPTIARPMVFGELGKAKAVSATITWSGLTVASKNGGPDGTGKVILNAISGYVEPSRMLAIMGPSGCGKSTLLDSLAGRLPRNVSLSGKVLVNGHRTQLTHRSAYVAQDEVLIGTLSVRETLQYTALLRLDKHMTHTDKMHRVEEVLEELGLMDCAATNIGNWYLKGVSGGQRRRVAIGCELITQPTLLFLDEPTSGLDAASAYHVMSVVNRLAQRQRTVLTVIHQPSSEVYELFDNLCLLSVGEVVYFGAAIAALAMFDSALLPCPNNRNPSDHFLHCINSDFKAVADLKGHCEDVDANRQKLLDVFTATLKDNVALQLMALTAEGEHYNARGSGAAWLSSVLVLTRRNFLVNIRDIGVFWLRLGMYVMLCLCIGTIYYNLDNSWKASYNRASLIFFTASFLTFMSISAFPAFVVEMSVFVRERLAGTYGVSTFAIANTLASMPFIFVISVVCSMVMYWLIGLNTEGDRIIYWIINLFVALLTVESLMMAIAAIVPHFLMGIAAGAAVLGMFMLVCGFLRPVQELPAPVWRFPVHFIAFHSYAFAGLMHNEFDDTTYECACYASGGCGAAYTADDPCTIPGSDVLDYWTISQLNKWADVGIMVAMVFIYRVMFFCSLKTREFFSR